MLVKDELEDDRQDEGRAEEILARSPAPQNFGDVRPQKGDMRIPHARPPGPGPPIERRRHIFSMCTQIPAHTQIVLLADAAPEQDLQIPRATTEDRDRPSTCWSTLLWLGAESLHLTTASA